MQLAEQRALLDALVGKAVAVWSSEDAVDAIWLAGSLGRGDGDALSDVDLTLVAAPGRTQELVARVRERLGDVGPVAFVHDAPQNAPVEGTQLNVLYGTYPLPVEIDWSVWPPVAERPSDVTALFERTELPRGINDFASVLDEVPRGSNIPLAERLDHFRTFMVPILVKHAARGWFDSVARMLTVMKLDPKPIRTFDGARDYAVNVLAESGKSEPPVAIECIRRYISALDRMHRQL
jgi:predicted nucleotidyltransferase